LVNAGVARVVYATEDPNPEVSGFGLMHLREAGVEVDGPLMDDEARALNPGFNRRMERSLPLVRVKSAMSLDGRTAMASGESKWITTPHARADVQQYRARSCAVVSGVDTVVKECASLKVRPDELNIDGAEAAAAKQPLRVILDSKLRLPKACELVNAHSPILLVHAGADESLLEGWPSHVELLSLPGTDGRVDLRELLRELAKRECNEVLVEAGATLSGSFLKKGLLDELVVYMAPKLMGSGARPLFDLPLQSMAAQLPLFITDVRAVGQDWRITARPDFDG
jgi:diaminohydroxyphosphoribosylaminopyrimidine deaminase/5-amino-6-(5-phosphoribosylamino)uracil reductase